MTNYMLSDLLIFIGIIISIGAQIHVTSKYNKYKNIKNKRGLSGFDVAKEILDKNGLSDIYVTEIRGNLTDHYESSRKVIRLSTEVFHGTSIASVSVAAHEVGHALQDKESYNFMRIREKMFPLVKFSSYGGYISILIGIIFGFYELITLGIVFEVLVLLFQLITLPVEFDASSRAKNELQKYNILSEEEIDGSDKVLSAAALTYVASVLTTLLQILRLVLLFTRRND